MAWKLVAPIELKDVFKESGRSLTSLFVLSPYGEGKGPGWQIDEGSIQGDEFVRQRGYAKPVRGNEDPVECSSRVDVAAKRVEGG